MSYGYSQWIAQLNKDANARSLGVALGRVCIAHGIAVSAVADEFGVSRMTVYNWFKGYTHPHRALHDKIQRYINARKN